MQGLLRLSRAIDSITAFIGRWASWLIFAAVFVSAGNAVVRKLWDTSSNAWLELQWLLFGIAFMAAAPYTLQRNEHIRIDILSLRLPKSIRNGIELFGHAFMLIPLTLLMIVESWAWAMESFTSVQDLLTFGGLPLWPAKFTIVAGFAMLLIQAISEIIKRVAIMQGLIPDEHDRSGHGPPPIEIPGLPGAPDGGRA